MKSRSVRLRDRNYSFPRKTSARVITNGHRWRPPLMIKVTVQLAPGLTESFLIMNGAAHRVNIQGFVQGMTPVLPGDFVSVPVTVSARVA